MALSKFGNLRAEMDNRQHHLIEWIRDYNEIKHLLAEDLVRLLKLAKRMEKLKERMIRIDVLRRENATLLGVDIAESDAMYSFKREIRNIPAYIKEIDRMLKGYGRKKRFADLVKDDDPEIIKEETK